MTTPQDFLNEKLEEISGVARVVLSPDLGLLFSPNPVVPDVGTVEPGPMHSSSKYYAGSNYGYQSPESYKKVYGDYPRSYREIQKAQLEEEAKQKAKEEQTKLEDLVLGAQKDGKFYAGKDYGYQSAPSYKVITGAFPAGYVEPVKKSPTVINSPESKGTGSTSTTGQTQNPPKLSPELIALAQEERLAVATERAKDFARQQQILALYDRSSLEKSRLNTQRQVELENIKAWRDISQTQIEAQTRSAALTASLLTALQQPNVNFMGALSAAFDAGAAPFSARVRTRA